MHDQHRIGIFMGAFHPGFGPPPMDPAVQEGRRPWVLERNGGALKIPIINIKWMQMADMICNGHDRFLQKIKLLHTGLRSIDGS